MQNRIKELREKRGISQADIARRVHLTRSAVGYYETGKRGVSNNKTWQKLADYFNVSVPYLQGYVDEYIDIHDLNEEEQDVYNHITDMLCEEYPEDSVSWSKNSAVKFNKLLHQLGIQHKVNGQWILYKAYMGNKYTTTKLHTYTDKHGKDHAKPLTAWTQKGRRLIYDILRENDVLPLIEREDIA